MAVSLGRDGGAPTGGNGATGIVNVTWNQEVTAIDVTHRGLVNASGISYKAATGGFVTRTAEIECLDATAVMTRTRRRVTTPPTGSPPRARSR